MRFDALEVAAIVDGAVRRGAQLNDSQRRTLLRIRAQATVTVYAADRLFCAVGEPQHLHALEEVA